MRIKRFIALPLVACLLWLGACSAEQNAKNLDMTDQISVEKKQAVGVPAPDWADNAVMYEVNVRQYTKEGTFKAFEEHLSRLKVLGVDILWLMPIHPISEKKRVGTLGSYYSVTDYKAINPEFGNAEDFKSLVDKAHDMGFKVIMDWVANHTGWDHEWLSNAGWHTTDESGQIVHPSGTNWEDVADLNYENPDMSAAMLEAMKYWITEFDIDGYRADYASGVPTPFWEKTREELEKIKPVYMLAEDDQQIRLLSRAFNSNYGWGLYNLMNQVAKGNNGAEQVKKYAERLEKQYPKGTYPLNFTSNHDENSWSGTEYERLGDAVKTMATLSFTLPGMPLIYSGQEAGLDKRLQFFDKDEIRWGDLSMQAFYEELIRLKHENPALWNGSAGGSVRILEASDDRVLAFERIKDTNTVTVLMNMSAVNLQDVLITGIQQAAYQTFPAQEVTEIKGELSVDIKSWDYLIYTKQ